MTESNVVTRGLLLVSSCALLSFATASGCWDGSVDDPSAQARSPLTGNTFSSANLDLQVLTNSCGANQAQDFFQIVNRGTTSITLSDVSIKLWTNDTSSSAFVAQVSSGGCVANAAGSCAHTVSGVTASVAPFSPACGPDANHQANREITLTTTDHTVLAPGQRWANLQAGFHLANFSNFTPGTGTWYSPCLAGSSFVSDGHFAVYVQGNLVFSSGVNAPACRGPHGQQQLSGHITPAMAAAPLIGPVPQSQVINLAIGMPARDPSGLQAQLQQVSDPTSPSYRQYLSVTGFAAAHGALAADFQAAVAWANTNGLTVNNASPNQLILSVSGTPSVIAKALFANPVLRRRPDGTQFYVLDREPSLNLTPAVLHISNSNNFVVPHSRAITGGPRGAGSGPSGNYQGSDFRHAYASCTTRTGVGQRVGQIQFDGWSRADITTYESDTGLPNVPVTAVLLDGFTACPGDASGSICPSGGVETQLDIEMAIAMAPGLTEVVEFQGNNGADILNAMATRQPLINQLSGSWGFEFDANTQQLVNEFVLQGQSFFDASGDEGSFSTDPGDDRDLQNTMLVGGTILSMDGNGATYNSETGWPGTFGETLVNVPFPSFQQGINMSTNGGSTTSRNAPDFSFVAQGVEVVMTAVTTTPPSSTPGTHVGGVGGTSIAAPLWAGFMALINEQNAAAGVPPGGFVNPVFYALGKSSLYKTNFVDVVGNSNGNFTAVAGFDLVTGWGSGKCNLINQVGSFLPASTNPVGGGFHDACVLRPGGVVACWGNNASGELGDGTTTERHQPVVVSGLGAATAVTVGFTHTCALLSDGTVACWGVNTNGQLGDGTTTDRAAPAPVPGITGAIGITAGLEHACAVRSNGTVVCWGANGRGQVGDGTTTQRLTPTPVQGLNDAVEIVAGDFFNCARRSSGAVSCWGDGGLGQLGNGGSAQSTTPVGVQGVSTAIAIATGDEHACALLSSGGAVCWGKNLEGQLGDGTIIISRPNAVAVQGLTDGTAITAGLDYTCAIRANGTAVCWGENGTGSLGDGTNTSRTTPVAVVGLTNVRAIGAGDGNTCAILANNSVSCWGSNLNGGLGDGTTTDHNTPTPVAF